MIYQFTDLPVFIPRETYLEAIHRMVSQLLATGKVIGVYQVGGISTPGISDVDLYVVFQDDISFTGNPVKKLNFPDNYFFTHRLFGTCLRHAVKLEQFAFFKKYDLLGGKPTPLNNYFAGETETSILKRQIAVEYLIKAWYSNAIGMKFGSIKIRNLLLHSKAILLDLDFLEIRNGKLVDCINDVMEVRNSWFKHQPSAIVLSELVNRYEKDLFETINDCIFKYKFYLPDSANLQLSKRVFLEPSQRLQLKKSGISFPGILIRQSDKFMKIQNRLNNFRVEIPCESKEIPPIIRTRHEEMKSAFEYNHQFLPGFMCTGHGMNLFKAE